MFLKVVLENNKFSSFEMFYVEKNYAVIIRIFFGFMLQN